MIFPRLAELRYDHDYTQEQIAKILNCSRTAYSNYETGVRSIPIDKLLILAKHYKVSVDYLVGNSDSKTLIEATKK